MPEHYLFSYFKGNGETGLYLAYSRDAWNWISLTDTALLQPVLGKEKLMRDPCIILGPDGLFHLVWTTSWTDRGIGYANSPDLVNWSEQQYIPVMEHEPTARNCWAPEIMYIEEDAQYMIYWATTIPGRFTNADTTGDNNYNHRMYYVCTRDFNSFTPAKLLYEPGFNVIDATIIRDGEEYRMVLKDETRHPAQKNLKVAVSKSPYGGYTAASAPITGNYWAEGPTILKKDSQYIVYFDKYIEGKYGALVSADFKHWEDQSESLHLPQGIRHGTVFSLTDHAYKQLHEKLRTAAANSYKE